MEITTKATLVTELKTAAQTAVAWYTAIPADAFFTRHGETWSPSDNVDHLIRAVTPLTRGLKLPKFVLQILFGRAHIPSRSYAEICKAYEDVLATGVGASGAFLPDQQTPSDKQKQKTVLIDRLSKRGNDLAVLIDQKWTDAALDECLLPHPLLGKLTVREMLYFTIYHLLRHARPEGD